MTRDVVLLVVLVTVLGCSRALVLDGSADSEVELLKQKVLQLEQTLNGLVENIRTECNVKCPAPRSVAFMAELSKNLVNPANGHLVVWDTVYTNEGNAYNNGHGIFTAPVNGTYNFNLVASVPQAAGNHGLHLFIKLNYNKTGYIFLDQNHDYWLRRGTDVTLHLKQGDEVWVEVDDVTGSHTLGGCCFHSHFSGFLIQAD